MLTVLPVSWLVFRWGPPAWQLALTDLLYIPLYLGVALLCFVRAARSTGPERQAWFWVGLSPLCFGLGQSIWAYLEVYRHRDPFPSGSDLLFLLQPVVLGVGLLAFPRFPISRSAAIKRQLDVAVVMSAVLTVAWFGLGRHIVEVWQAKPVAMMVSLAYPALDVWLLTVLLWNALHRRERTGPGRPEHGPTTAAGGAEPLEPGTSVPVSRAFQNRPRGTGVLFVLSVLCSVIADVGFALTYGLPNYTQGNTSDLFWTLAALMLGMAALVGRIEGQTLTGQFVRRSNDRAGLRPSAFSRQLGIYGPHLALGTCFLLLFLSVHDQGLPSLLIGSALVTLLVALRQLYGTLENERLALRLSILSRDLEGRVRDRTNELEFASGAMRRLTDELDARVTERTAQLEASQALLAHQTRHDVLTGLPNRSLFEERLNGLLERSGAGSLTAVMYFDLDGFKIINDRFGHTQGDELLRELARRFQGLMRRPDGQVHPGDLLGRCGSDEFVLAFPQLGSPEDAESCARRVAAVVGGAFVVEGHPVQLTASIGVSLSPADSVQAAQLIRQADMAMSQGKVSQGKVSQGNGAQGNGAQGNGSQDTAGGHHALRFYAPQMDQAAQGRETLLRRLRLALAETARGGAGGLSLAFQPQYGLQGAHMMNGCPTGFEALLRWTDAELGPVSPADFIPVAEDSGLIVPLGRWVLRQACGQMAQWPGVRVAVNVAPAQFEHPEFVQDVCSALAEYGVRGAQLELELTERQVMNDPLGTASKMHELRALGVLVALDDFGVGQSALGHLLKLPVSVLKVDRIFIQGLHEVSGAPRVLQAIVALAHALDIRVVAEGVETQAQLGLVRDLGCDQVQGYLTGRPVAAREAGALLALTRAL